LHRTCGNEAILISIADLVVWYGVQVSGNHYNHGLSWKKSFKFSYTPQAGVRYSGDINFEPQGYNNHYLNYFDTVNTARTEARFNYE